MTPTKQKAMHTKSPWHIGVRQPSSDKFIYGPYGEEVADCDRKTNFPNENLANARLIAAAPELLAALKDLTEAYRALGEQWAIERCEDGNFEAEGEVLFPIDNCEASAKAAIKLAEGNS